MPHARRFQARFAAALLALALIASACGGSDDDGGLSAAPATPVGGDIVLATPEDDATPAGSTTEADSENGDGTESETASEATDDAAPTSVPEDPGPTPTAVLPPGTIELLRPEVIETYPHDITAYTQGLEVMDGLLLESTGRQGHPGGDVVYESDVRRVDIATGEVVQRADAPGTVFGEGLTRVGDELIQITWQDQRAFWWDAETFEFLREVSYEGQGWGLCFDGERLVMTDGSEKLFFRDPVTFDLIGEIRVTQSGTPIASLNELECIDGKVWANVYRTDFIIRIDPDTGFVDGIVDAASLEQPRVQPTEVLNGIAWDAETDTWLVTGKFWPTMYRVRFVSDGITN